MTLKEVIDNIIYVAKSQPNIKTVKEGNVYDLDSMPDVEYKVVYLTQSQHRFDNQQNTYNFTLFYIDRLTDDSGNKIDIHSDGIVTINNILNGLQDCYDMEVETPVSVTTFNQRFVDDCAGVFASVSIVVDNDLGYCYYE